MNASLQAYEKFAEFYDEFMGFSVADGRWMENMLKKNGFAGRSILDLGCGTGAYSLYFHKRGYQVVGVDASIPMLKYARNKVVGSGFGSYKGVSFVCSDLTRVSFKQSFDACVAFQVLNHIHTEEELRTLFKSVYEHLAEPGYFLVHLTSVSWFRRHTGDRIHKRRRFVCKQQFEEQPEAHLVKRVFEFFPRDGIPPFQVSFVDKIHFPTKILNLLLEAQFKDPVFWIWPRGSAVGWTDLDKVSHVERALEEDKLVPPIDLFGFVVKKM